MEETTKSYKGLLNEAKKDTIVIGWGRFNPPTVGHEKLILRVAEEARKRNAEYRIYPTKSEDPRKNPLSFQEKVRFMRAMFPKHSRNISSNRNVATVIQAAQELDKRGYKNLVLVAGSDRVPEFKTLLNKYNGKEYNFETVDVVNAGERDPDAEGVTGMSASKMRAAAADNDFNSFKGGIPRTFRQAKKMFNSIRKGMNVNEDFKELVVNEEFEETLQEQDVITMFEPTVKMVSGGQLDYNTEDDLQELTKKQKLALTAAGAVIAAKALQKRAKKDKKFGKDLISQDKKEPKKLKHPQDDGKIEGSRFIRMLRFGLSPEGTGDIPLVKRAFKDMYKAGSNPLLREKIFKVTDKVFDYILNDDIIYNRFVVLLHRKEIFGEETMKNYNELSQSLDEAKGTSALSDINDHPEKMNYVGKFSNSTMAKGFISDLVSTQLGSVTWVSADGSEVQFRVNKSSAGQEIGTLQVGRENRPVNASQKGSGSDVSLVYLAAKFGGKISKFEGDIREGLIDQGPEFELTEGLRAKAEKADIPYDIVAEVYARGLKSWEDDEVSSEMTPQQWAFSRVNSFISGGKATTTCDADLWEEYLERDPDSELDLVFEEELLEKSPPSAEAERFIKKNKSSFKEKYGNDWEQVLYSTAWKMHNKHWEEVEVDLDEVFEDEAFEVEINEDFESEVLSEAKKREGNTYDKAGEWGTDAGVRSYKADTPGETPDAPYDALDGRYSLDKMYRQNSNSIGSFIDQKNNKNEELEQKRLKDLRIKKGE